MPRTTLGEFVRPTTIDEVIGQKSAKRQVQSAIDSDERRCLLFFGPPGTGKTTFARIVARDLQGRDFPSDCDPDVMEINAADLTGVDSIRVLLERTVCYPFPPNKYRVIILDEAQQLSSSAQNMLLKPFEDRNSVNVWIVCTTDRGKLIQPLQDRCTIIRLRPLSADERLQLINRANQGLFPPDENIEGESLQTFIDEVQNKELDIPRNIVKALQAWHEGLPANEAVELALPSLIAKKSPR